MTRTDAPGLAVMLWLGSLSAGFAEPAQPLVIVRSGALPIILTAPHGGEVAIPGSAVRSDKTRKNFTVARDARTNVLTEKVAAALASRLGREPFVVIASFARKYVDANRAERDAYEASDAAAARTYEEYHAAVAEARDTVTKRFARGLLLDIHGQGLRRDVIFRGTSNRRSVTQLLERFGEPALSGPNSVFGALAAKRYGVYPALGSSDREHPRYNGGYTVQTYGSRNGGTLDAVQLEFGTRYRAEDQLDQTANDLADAVVVFAREYLPLEK